MREVCLLPVMPVGCVVVISGIINITDAGCLLHVLGARAQGEELHRDTPTASQTQS